MLQKKVCILGPSGVGKTSLVKQFVEGIFSEKYLTSIGVKIDKKIVNEGFTPVQLLLWDLEGVDKYCGFNPRYLRGSSAFIFVADRTRMSSIAETMEIFSLAKQHLNVPAVLAINKQDLPLSIKWEDNLLDKHRDSFDSLFLTSAKTGQSVEQMFRRIAELVTA
uniref:Rab family GTPase n=1 Tax=Ningiella ruwaisensis TaxID=2364274 RepID=UPI00109FF5C6|nr:Rab family GTPase [Ningiella ruwaisensis]